MQQTDENIDWAIEQIEGFLHLRYAPDNPKVIRKHAEALLRIVHDHEPVAQAVLWPDGSKHDRAEWLITRATDVFTTKYPNPMDFRKMYSKFWKPWDGKYGDELEVEALGD